MTCARLYGPSRQRKVVGPQVRPWARVWVCTRLLRRTGPLTLALALAEEADSLTMPRFGALDLRVGARIVDRDCVAANFSISVRS